MCAAKTPKKAEKPIDFEQNLRDLEEIVRALEAGNLPLEESLNEFAKGIELVSQGEKYLKDAEQRIKILLEKNAQAPLADFSSDNAEDDF